MIARGRAHRITAQCAKFNRFNLHTRRASHPETHTSLRLVIGSAGPCDTRQGYRQLRGAIVQRTLRHLACDFFGNSAMRHQRSRRDAQHLAFGRVGVGDKAALEHR